MTACQQLFTASGLTGSALQSAVEAQFPNGECEQVPVSPFSPGPVADGETLTRLIFHPVHTHPHTGVPIAMAFADAWSSDLSVFREERATDAEITLAIEQMKQTGLKKTPLQDRSVIGVMTATTARVRSEVTANDNVRAFRVYDTAEELKPHHASVFLTHAGRTKFTEKVARKRLFEIFAAVSNYRTGRLPTEPSATGTI